ncbi:MAG: cation-transporting P-type ATPase, partial [Thermoanaerobaculia bacterium]
MSAPPPEVPPGNDRPATGGDRPWFALERGEIFGRLRTGASGLTSAEAERRLREHGRNELREHEELSWLGVLVA